MDTTDDVNPGLQSGPLESDVEEKEKLINKVLIIGCLSFGVIFVALSWFHAGILQFLHFWLAIALIAGSSALAASIGGNCREGAGELLPDPEPVEKVLAEPEKRIKVYTRRSDAISGRVPSKENLMSSPAVVSKDDANRTAISVVDQQSRSGAKKEWTGEEIELLRKQLMKFPRGTSRRWAVVAEVFADSHSTEDVKKMSKLLGKKKFTDGDSHAKYLAQRKGGDKVIDSPLSQRWDGDQGDASNGTKSDWTKTEDKALVSAWKTIPERTPKRWYKIAKAVPGRSKTECAKRFREVRPISWSSKDNTGQINSEHDSLGDAQGSHQIDKSLSDLAQDAKGDEITSSEPVSEISKLQEDVPDSQTRSEPGSVNMAEKVTLKSCEGDEFVVDAMVYAQSSRIINGDFYRRDRFGWKALRDMSFIPWPIEDMSTTLLAELLNYCSIDFEFSPSPGTDRSQHSLSYIRQLSGHRYSNLEPPMRPGYVVVENGREIRNEEPLGETRSEPGSVNMAKMVTLEGSDGVKMEANAETIASASPVLKNVMEKVGVDATIRLPNVQGLQLLKVICYCEMRYRSGDSETQADTGVCNEVEALLGVEPITQL